MVIMEQSSEGPGPVRLRIDDDVQVPELILKEWSLQTTLLNGIPEKAQKGFQTLDLHLTCVGVISDYIALGTNVGLIYWYSRKHDSLERLKFEGTSSSPVVCISVVSCENYMIAAGNREGQVAIFQIPKTIPNPNEEPGPPFSKNLHKTKVKIYTVRGIHNSSISALTWSSNGMKVFSGDMQGTVAETQIDFFMGLCKSFKLLFEENEIVQLSYSNQRLLVSSNQRTILYWSKTGLITKVGNQERKAIGPFGAVFGAGIWSKNMKLYAARPGLRLWLADHEGTVQNTLLYKESIKNSQAIISLINPGPPRPFTLDRQFSILYNFMGKYLVTTHNSVLYVLDPSTAKVVSTCSHLKSIISIDVHNDEIFIIESNRNIVRIASTPEIFVIPDTINRGLLDSVPVLKTDFRIPDQPFKLIASKIKETSLALPKFSSSSLITTMRNVLEADISIQDGYIPTSSVIPMSAPIPTTVEVTDPPAESPLSPDVEQYNTERIEKFDQISKHSFQEVLLDQFKPDKKARKMKRSSEIASSDSVSLSSQGSTNSERVSSSSGTTPEKEPEFSKSPDKDFGIGQCQDFTEIETQIPTLLISEAERRSKEEMLANMLQWSELLPSFETSLPTIMIPIESDRRRVSDSSDTSENDEILVSGSPCVEPSFGISSTEEVDYGAILDEMKTFHCTTTNGYEPGSTSASDLYSGGQASDCGEYDHYASIYDDNSSQTSSSRTVSNGTLTDFFGPPSGSSNVTLCDGNFQGCPKTTAHVRSQNGQGPGSLLSIIPVQDMRVTGEILHDYWIQYELPLGVTMASTSDKYLVCVDALSYIYYSSLAQETNELCWIKASFRATQVISSPDGSIFWRINQGGILSGVEPGGDPFNESTTWDIICDKVKYATIGHETAFILKTDNTLYGLRLNKDTPHPPLFEHIPTPTTLLSVHVLDESIWALGTDGKVFYRSNVGYSVTSWYGDAWNELKLNISPVVAMSLGPQGSVWMVDTQNQICFINDFVSSRGKYIMWNVSISEELNSLAAPPQQPAPRSLSQWTQKLTRWSSSTQISEDACVPILSSCHSIVTFALSGGNSIYLNKTCTSGHKWDVLAIENGTPKRWKLKNIYAGGIYNNHGFLWLEESKGKLFCLRGGRGSLLPIDTPCSNIVTIAAAPEALWVLDTHGIVYGRCNINPDNELGNGWDRIELSPIPEDRKIVHISCGSEIVWSCDDRGDVYIRNGSLNPPCSTDFSPAWIKVDGSPNYGLDAIFTKVYVGPSDRIVFALDSRGAVYAREAVFPDLPIGTSWVLIPSVEAVSLAISESAVWALSPHGEIYRRSGISSTNFVGDSWKRIPGTAKVLTVSICDEVWALDGHGVLLKHLVEELYLRFTNNDSMTKKVKARIIEDDDDSTDWEFLG